MNAHVPPPTASISAITVLRAAVPADAAAIEAVFTAAVRHSCGTRCGDTAQQSSVDLAEWTNLVDPHTPPDAVIVAVDDHGDIVGFSAVDSRRGELSLLFVHPAHARHGIGRALLDDAHRILGDGGHSEVFLYVEEDNLHAADVYAAAGYRRDGVIRVSYPPGAIVREFRMVKSL